MKIENKILTIEVDSVDDILKIEKVKVKCGNFCGIFMHKEEDCQDFAEEITELEIYIPHEICKKCGATIIGNELNYCSRCGKPINGKEET